MNSCCWLFLCFCVVTSQVIAKDVGDQIPMCQLNDLSDRTKPLDINLGQVTYIDFWASWCGPCAKSFPYMKNLQNTLKGKGLQIIAVNLDENVDEAYDFLRKIPANFTLAYDPGQECAKSFDVKAMPSTYLVDKKGMIRYIHLGFRQGEVTQLQAMIEKILAE